MREGGFILGGSGTVGTTEKGGQRYKNGRERRLRDDQEGKGKVRGTRRGKQKDGTRPRNAIQGEEASGQAFGTSC